MLDRKVSDKRIFPAMDVTKSGTRKEELLVEPDILRKMYVLRRILNPMGTVDAMEFLMDKIRQTKTNSRLLRLDEHLDGFGAHALRRVSPPIRRWRPSPTKARQVARAELSVASSPLIGRRWPTPDRGVAADPP